MKKLFVLLVLAVLGISYAQTCEDGFRLAQHAGGETCIPEAPQRIAVVGDRNIGETLVALGIDPIAVANKGEYPSFVQEEFTDFDGVTDLGWFDEPNLETLLGVNPDLIVMHDDENAGSGNLYDQVSEIAPTVQIDPFTDVRQVSRDVGAIFGEEQVTELIALVDDAVERVASAVENPSEITVSSIFFRATRGVMLITPDRLRTHAVLLQDAGFVLPESQSQLTSQTAFLSLEELSRADADVVFVVRSFNADSTEETDELLNSPLWQSLEAVQNNNVIEGNVLWWSVGGPLSAQRTANEIVAGLQEIGLATKQ